MQDKETENLVKKAKQRDPDAFTDLMQLYLKDMYRTALAILMNDEDAADDKTWLNFCNVRSGSEDVIQSIWGEDTDIERYNSGIQKMLDHTVITCTVEYADHTTRSADIQVDSRIMTRREAGEQLDPGMDPQELEEETVVITFELQK